MLTRRGATLVELVVAMSLTAVILGAGSSTLVRQRRTADDHAARASAEAQLRTALAELEAALDGLSSGAGDLVAGQARDTAIQLRTVVASGIACDSGAGQVTLAADDSSADRTSGFAATPQTGDTLWWRASGAASWVPRRVTDVSLHTGTCAIAGSGEQASWRLAFAAPDTLPRGTPVRLTRQMRFSFYRARDDSWQLGISDWSEVLHAFASPQPVAGPFTRIAVDGTRTGFRYFDASGVELANDVNGVDVSRVARVRITAVVPRRRGVDPSDACARDSLDVALNRAP